MAINFQTLLDKVAARLEWIEPPPVYIGAAAKDPLASEDLEDIAALMDGCSELTDKVRQAPGDLREFVSESIRQVLNNETLKQALAVHLPRGGDEDARERNLFVRLDRLL